MKIKTTDLKNSALSDRIYEKPEARSVKLTTEGLLCTSMPLTTVENYQEQEFKW